MKKCKSILFCLLAVLLLTACTSVDEVIVPEPTTTLTATVRSTTTTAEQAAIAAAAKAKSATVEIDGITYRNSFVGDGFHLLKEYNFYSSTPVFEERQINLLGAAATPYFLFEYDLVFKGRDSSWGDNTGENIYCREDKWEELRAYYANEENFNYYYRATDADGSVTIPAVDPEKFDALRVFSDDNAYGTGRNIAQTRRLTEPGSFDGPFFTFYKDSNDGLFGTHTLKYFIWECDLVFYRYSSGGSHGYIEVSILPDELEQYFIAIVSDS